MGKSLVIFCLMSMFILFSTRRYSCKGSSVSRCKPFERAALLNLKHNLIDFDKNVSPTWEGDDCCKWKRVSCDNTTGHILRLRLNGDVNKNLFQMEKLESLVYLLELKQLESLDLSLNNFSYRSIPTFMGSMKQLRYLNLSSSSFGGLLPRELGNLTNLRVLDMSGGYEVVVDSVKWAAGLRELRYLNMDGADMSIARDWSELLIVSLPYMSELHLSFCGLTLPAAAQKNSSSAARPPIRYLDLSRNIFLGEFPRILQNLTSLEHLDLSSSISLAQFYRHGNNLSNINSRSLWGLVHKLCALRSLDMSGNDLEGNFLQPRQNLSDYCENHYDLVDLFITYSSLSGDIPAWLGENFRSLGYVALSNNMLSGEIPSSLGKLSNLKILDLSQNMLSGEIPSSLSKLSTVRELHLTDNMLSGDIPASFVNLSNLKVLDLSENNLTSSHKFPSNLESLVLSGNQLSDKILISIGQLNKLQILDISSNPLEGTVLSELHVANLSSMISLSVQDTFLTLNLSSDWVPPFNLEFLNAGNCKINGQVPSWLQTQKNLELLFLYNANISGIMPRWLHTMQALRDVDLSNNKLSGPPIFPVNFFLINLFNNTLSGNLLSNDSYTEVFSDAVMTYLSYNFISGPLPEHLGHVMPNLLTLVISNNQISGAIPESLCQITSLRTLAIENNRLSGVIPNCWAGTSSLSLVNLSYNKLKGEIPCFFGKKLDMFGLRDQFYLHLNDNILSGQVPSCLSDLTYLQVLDLGGNQLSGKMTDWFTAKTSRALKILRLRGNNFTGNIPSHICSSSQLQLLDLGYNRFTGSLPYCLSNLTAMSSSLDMDATSDGDLEEVNEVIQGIERGYTSTLQYLVDIDFSCNNFVGNIPEDITNLSSLLNLNLSYNQLSGTIPQNMGGLKSLISLDLSNNKLSGMIPTSLGDLYSLSHLNLSYNNLSGQIPTGSQLQTLPNTAYVGNPYLCGDSLPKKCKTKIDKQGSNTTDEDKGDDEDRREKLWFVLVVMSGVATGFWGVVGSLVLKRSWRNAFYRRVEVAYDWVYLMVALRIAKLNNK